MKKLLVFVLMMAFVSTLSISVVGCGKKATTSGTFVSTGTSVGTASTQTPK